LFRQYTAARRAVNEEIRQPRTGEGMKEDKFLPPRHQGTKKDRFDQEQTELMEVI
jgi:hypothetical protein